ncbi:hypothetical protein AC578_8885 [Pseudocercospora eumusae]|uniref:Uncharacterized protein n=1 Tax=Pseudocercospora eumusae TaxID=321146 RepID=A0A139HBL6_9PEZI|nr:hypothetical protein AC578_8885 [Pseudocercospora eumusae]
MGQRHQLFIIAKIGARYRVLAGAHNQWLYAHFAVRRCQHILKILRTNAAVVRQELQHAAEYDWLGFDKNENKHKIMGFPILATILSVGAAGKESGYSARIHSLPLSIRPSQCDNNDGFTVMDVSKPDQPRYCFFLRPESDPLRAEVPDDENVVSGQGSEEDDYNQEVANAITSPQPDTALSAAQYLAAYRMSMSDLRDESLDESSSWWTALPMIPTAALLSAWPGEPFKICQDDNAHDVVSGGSDRQVQSLRENSFAEVLNRAWQSDPNDLSWLDEARLLPDLNERIIRALRDKPDLIFESSGMALFGLATRGHNEIDLSYFRGLTSQMLVSLLEQIDPEHERRLHLTLPCMVDLTTEHITQILRRHRIDSLRLGYTEKVSGEEVYAVALSHPALILTHPSIFKEAVVAENEFANSAELNPLLAFKPRHRSPLVQILYANASLGGEIAYLQDGGVAWSKEIRNFSPWKNNEAAARVLPLPVEDAVLPLTELIAVLPSALRKLMNDEAINFLLPYAFAPTVAGVAKALAIDREGHVWPLPAELHASYVQSGRSSHEPLAKTKAIEQGSWSLLICVENPAENVEVDTTDPSEGSREVMGNKLRYAFVTKDAAGEVVAVDALEFLHQVEPRRTQGEHDSLASEFVQDLSNTIPGEPAAVLCSRMEAAEVAKAAEIYNEHIDTWIKDMAKRIEHWHLRSKWSHVCLAAHQSVVIACFQYHQRMEHPANESQNEPRMLFLRSIHQAKATGKTFCVPSWFEFFVLDKTKDQLSIALSKAIREVTDLAKKVPSATRVRSFWQQLSGPLMLDEHLFELAAEYICILLSLACVTVIRLRQTIKTHAKAEDQARYESRRSTPDIYADVADSPLEHCVRRFIDTIEQGSGIVTLGPPNWRDIAILSGTYTNLSRTSDSGVSAPSLQSLWTTEHMLRTKFQDEPDELLAPKPSYAYHLWKFYSTRWKPLESADFDYRNITTTKLRKRSVRSTWLLIHAACGDFEDLFAWYRARNGVFGKVLRGRVSREVVEEEEQRKILKVQRETETEKEKSGGGGFLNGAASSLGGRFSGMKSKAVAAGGKLRFGPFRIKSVSEMA